LSLGGKSASLRLEEWAQAVLKFSEQVDDFYRASSKKAELNDFDEAGWSFFWRDWKTQKQAARRVLGAA
jgi:hypothetical protein